MAISWPGHVKDVGGIRNQFHHVIDILPTILEVTGIPAPQMVNGIRQKPIEGVSMAYTFDDATAPSRRDVQYFEMVGDRALYQDGWKIVARHRKGEDFDTDHWELFRMADDYSEVNDLSVQNPERVRHMVERWWQEAERFGVLPLDDREAERALDWFRSSAP